MNLMYYIFFLLQLACNINGNVGDGTEQGTCPNGKVCYSDGSCGNFYKHVHNFHCSLNTVYEPSYTVFLPHIYDFI